MTDHVIDRVAQWVIDARRARYTADCRHPFVDGPCHFGGHVTAGIIPIPLIPCETLLPKQLADELKRRQRDHVPGGSEVSVHIHARDLSETRDGHTMADCIARFTNTGRFGGFPFVPTPGAAV